MANYADVDTLSHPFLVIPLFPRPSTVLRNLESFQVDREDHFGVALPMCVETVFCLKNEKCKIKKID